jgi:hypothetical protein
MAELMNKHPVMYALLELLLAGQTLSHARRHAGEPRLLFWRQRGRHRDVQDVLAVLVVAIRRGLSITMVGGGSLGLKPSALICATNASRKVVSCTLTASSGDWGDWAIAVDNGATAQ